MYLKKIYFVYVLTNLTRSTLYIGVTNSLEKRMMQHQVSAAPSFTQKYKTFVLIYFECFEHAESAIAREKQIKKWSRSKKEWLIAKVNPEWNEISFI